VLDAAVAPQDAAEQREVAAGDRGGVGPRTRPPLEALSAMVSSRPMRQSVMRLSMISMAGRA
jgi:hypothetical protein